MGILRIALIALLTLSSLSQAASTPSSKDLNNVRTQINQTDKAVKAKQGEKQKVVGDIQELDSKIRTQQNKLNKISQEKQMLIRQLQQLQQQAATLETKINSTRTHIARLLNAQYRHGGNNAMSLMLQPNDMDEKDRLMHYLLMIQQGNKATIENYQKQQIQLEQIHKNIAEKSSAIQKLVNEEQLFLQKLQNQKHTQIVISSQIDDELTEQQKKLKKLKSDEGRLAKLLKNLAAQKKKAQQAAAKKAAKAKKSASSSTNRTNMPQNTGLLPDEMAPKPSNFSRREGSLSWPVAGKVIGHYGAPRVEGITWDGLYISARQQPVHAVADGLVRSTTTLDGFGKMIVIEHSDGYQSIYAGLNSFSVREREKVKQNQIIGISGALPDEENGLLFKFFYYERVMNPMPWLVSR